jgi:hypothetical protein
MCRRPVTFSATSQRGWGLGAQAPSSRECLGLRVRSCSMPRTADKNGRMHVTVLLEDLSPAIELAYVPLLLLPFILAPGLEHSLTTSVKETREGPRVSATLSVGNRTAPPGHLPPLPQRSSGRIGQNQARTMGADRQRVPHRPSGRTSRTSCRYPTTEGQRQVGKGLSSCIAVCLSRVSAECRPAHESESGSLLRMGGGAQVDKYPSFRSPRKARPPHRCPSTSTPPPLFSMTRDDEGCPVAAVPSWCARIQVPTRCEPNIYPFCPPDSDGAGYVRSLPPASA